METLNAHAKADGREFILLPQKLSRPLAVVKPVLAGLRPQGELPLEETLKIVDHLHRLMVQRGRLVHTMENLKQFEIDQKDDAEDTSLNYYQGCQLEIMDDQRRKFSTKNPEIIKAVAEYIFSVCIEKLTHIESAIVFPK